MNGEGLNSSGVVEEKGSVSGKLYLLKSHKLYISCI